MKKAVMKEQYPELLRRKKRFNVVPYLFVLPAMLLFCVFTFYPFIRAFVLSFFVTNKRGQATKFVGLANWTRVLGKEEFWNVIGITLKMAAINLVFTFSIAMCFGLLATKKVNGSKVYQTMYALPMAIASSPAAAIFLFFYSRHNGVLNNLLGTDIAWLLNEDTALYCVCAMAVWQHVGSSFIFLLVGFRNVPDELIESAYLDGAGPWRRIKSIIIPIASPQIFFVLFLNINSSFKTFNQIKLLTGGGPANKTKNLIYYIYDNAIIHGRFETACVQAIFLFLMIFGLTRIQFFCEKRFVHYQ